LVIPQVARAGGLETSSHIKIIAHSPTKVNAENIKYNSRHIDLWRHSYNYIQYRQVSVPSDIEI